MTTIFVDQMVYLLIQSFDILMLVAEFDYLAAPTENPFGQSIPEFPDPFRLGYDHWSALDADTLRPEVINQFIIAGQGHYGYLGQPWDMAGLVALERAEGFAPLLSVSLLSVFQFLFIPAGLKDILFAAQVLFSSVLHTVPGLVHYVSVGVPASGDKILVNKRGNGLF